jgi:hypothetical protein
MKRTMSVIATAVGLALAVPTVAEARVTSAPVRHLQEAAPKSPVQLSSFGGFMRMIFSLRPYSRVYE